MTVRSFNINEIMGHFKRDKYGRIEARDNVLYKRQFRDLDGNIVNNKGYLIDPDSGDIRSKYTFETVFPNYQLTGTQKSEIPLPFRLECYNFNQVDSIR